MTQPIDLKEVEKLIVLYYRRLAHTNPDKLTQRRTMLLKTIQVLEHYLALCTVIDSPIEYVE
ncbi:hypothetical protein ES705_19570 [subsurface metagenome]